MDRRIAAGFDPRWQTPEDFVLGITREIWEERRIDALREHYAADVLVRSPVSVLRGNDPVVAATLATLAEFPDRQLLGEDVIWAGTDAQQGDGRAGFLSSHRLLSRATHAGDGVYGRATGRAVAYRILAECWCCEGAVRDEWLVRDQSAILHQLGQDPRAWVQARLSDPKTVLAAPLSPDTDPDGPYRGTGTRDEPAEELAGRLKEIMAGDLSVIPKAWDRAASLAYPGGVTGHGWQDADAFWLGLRSAFPSAAFRIDHRIGRKDAGRPLRAAVRWSLYGRHDGWGSFGAPSGTYVYVMGITHAEFGPRGLHREWTLIDETAIWTQIELARG